MTTVSYKECIFNLIKWHYETMNIWSMILVNIVSLICFVYIVNLYSVPILPFALLYLSSTIHLPFSIGYHLFRPMPQHIKYFWYKLDFSFIFIGICLLIIAMSYTMPIQYRVVLILVAIVISYISILHTISKNPNNKNKRRNAVMVASITSLILVPLIYTMVTKEKTVFGITGMITLGIIVCLIFGAITYTTGFLNQYTPTWNSSHATMHFMVAISHVLEYLFVLHAIMYKT